MLYKTTIEYETVDNPVTEACVERGPYRVPSSAALRAGRGLCRRPISKFRFES